jgi:small GTP-binding protein
MTVHGKVILVGDSQVGKTSLIDGYRKKFSLDTVPTIGALSHRVVVKLAGNRDVELNVWDTVGHEEYKSFVPMFSRGAEVVVLVFDLLRRLTFKHLDGWLSFFHDKEVQWCRVIVVGNKCDLPGQEIDETDIGAFMTDYPGVPCFCASAKTGVGVQDLFCEVARSSLIRGRNMHSLGAETGLSRRNPKNAHFSAILRWETDRLLLFDCFRDVRKSWTASLSKWMVLSTIASKSSAREAQNGFLHEITSFKCP